MTSALFTPFKLRGLTLPNRIVVPPMCTYSATDGRAADWHLYHWANILNSGAGMVIVEAVAVTPEGRITNNCLGLWDDGTAQTMGDALGRARKLAPSVPVCVQLAHAGRKGSSATPWEGGELLSEDENGWETVAPSSVQHLPHEPPPTALDKAGMARIRKAFVASAERAAQIGADAVEVHTAHGYLLHQFLSPLANRRNDRFGGSFDNRLRFPMEVVESVREVFEGVVGVRISATDWVEGGWDLEEAADYTVRLREAGVDYVHVSSGGVSPDQKIPLRPGYQLPHAKRIKDQSGLPTIAVGLITEPSQAEEIISDGDADMVAIGRGMLYDPRWGWHAAAKLDAHVEASPQYWRSAPHGTGEVFFNAKIGGR